jgi:hypothetical protein
MQYFQPMAATQTKPDKKIIEVSDAAQAAIAYANKLFPPSVRSEVSLEEVELTEDEKYWLITLGLTTSGQNTAKWAFGPPKAKFKRFKVDARTGRVVAMTIRAIE